MNTMFGSKQLSQYNRSAALSAPPARLLTMLYDRLLLDLGRAEAAQLDQDWAGASEQLLHAQAIVTELSTTLDMTAWDGADALMAVYSYVSAGLIDANIHRNVSRTRECITMLEPLRLTWHEAAAALPAQATAEPLAMAAAGGMLGVG
ncbi:MAG TPA: flagellar export chaperone FliS [Micrococcaceae bacterium]|jgi:flagellar protein FliS